VNSKQHEFLFLITTKRGYIYLIWDEDQKVIISRPKTCRNAEEREYSWHFISNKEPFNILFQSSEWKDYRKQYDWCYFKVKKINAIRKLCSINIRGWSSHDTAPLLALILSWATYKGKFGIINKMDNVSWSVILTDVKADNLSAYIALWYNESTMLIVIHVNSVYYSFNSLKQYHS